MGATKKTGLPGRWAGTVAVSAASLLLTAVAAAGPATASEGHPGRVETAGPPLTVRTGPGTEFPTTGRRLPDGTRVTVTCQIRGESISGTFGTSTWWDKLSSGGFVSDAYVFTGSDGRVAPECPSGRQAEETGQTVDPPEGFVHENVSAWELADRWRDDKGGKYYFTDGDIITEQLRNDPWLSEIRRRIGNDLPLRGQQQKSLLDIPETGRVVLRDPPAMVKYLKREETSDAAIFYLGSYVLKYKVEPLGDGRFKATYDITNETTGSSFQRYILPCYLIDCPVPPMWNNPMQTQWVHMTEEFRQTLPLSCEVPGGYCPPRLGQGPV